MALTKETSRNIYNCYQQIEACDKLKSDIEEFIETQKRNAEKKDDPIPVNSYARYGRGCQMGIPEVGCSTSSMRIFDISYELALLVIDEHRKNLVRLLDDLQRIAIREQTADFSRNSRLFTLIKNGTFQFHMKDIPVMGRNDEKILIGKLAEQIGYAEEWATNMYDRTEALNDDAIDIIVRTFRFVNREWLADGVGEMLNI